MAVFPKRVRIEVLMPDHRILQSDRLFLPADFEHARYPWAFVANAMENMFQQIIEKMKEEGN